MFLEFRVEISMLWLFLLCFCFIFWDKISLCDSERLEFIVLQPYFSECLDYKSVTACLAGMLCLSPEWLPTLGLCPKSTEAIDLTLVCPCFDHLTMSWAETVWYLNMYLVWVASWLTVWTPHKPFFFFSKQSPWNIFREHLFLSLLFWPNFAVNSSTIYFVQKMSLLLSGFL